MAKEYKRPLSREDKIEIWKGILETANKNPKYMKRVQEVVLKASKRQYLNPN